jgi:methylmalonyl-CoA/ethylmalonyl-CoA epimerase
MENKFELAHVGIHNQSLEEAENLSKTLCTLFNLTGRRGKKSVFAGEYFECMREPYLGTHGHIAMRTADLDAAVEELQGKGFDFNMDTAAYDGEGHLTNIYLAGEFGGFAIHILRK